MACCINGQRGHSMEQQVRQQLEAAGVQVEDALYRFMGNEGLMLKFLLRFPQDENFGALQQAMDRGDVGAAYQAAHTLKGVAGNLAIEPLFTAASAVVEELRAEQLQEAAERMPALEEVYLRTVALLGALDG